MSSEASRRGSNTATALENDRTPGWRVAALDSAIHLLPAASLSVALAIIGALLATSGTNPVTAASILFHASLSSPTALSTTATKMCPILFVGLGTVVAMRANRWNLGAPGQMYLGALGAVVVAVYVVPGAGPLIVIPLSIFGGAVAGALWMAAPALLRARRGTAELITTLLLNTVALDVITALVQGPLGQESASTPESPSIPAAARLPRLWPGATAHAGLLLALVVAVLLAVVISRTNFGFELRAIGRGEAAARATGIRVVRRATQALFLSAALCGVAGAVEILGVTGRLVPGFEAGNGFIGLAVALLGRGTVLGTVAGSVFFGVLLAGTPALNFSLGVPPSLVTITQGMAITGVVVGYALQGHIRRRRGRG